MTDLVIMFKFDEYRKINVDSYNIEFVPLYKTEQNYGTHLVSSTVTITRNEDGDTMIGVIDSNSSKFNMTKDFDKGLALGTSGNRIRKIQELISFFLKDGFLSIQIERRIRVENKMVVS